MTFRPNRDAHHDGDHREQDDPFDAPLLFGRQDSDLCKQIHDGAEEEARRLNDKHIYGECRDGGQHPQVLRLLLLRSFIRLEASHGAESGTDLKEGEDAGNDGQNLRHEVGAKSPHQAGRQCAGRQEEGDGKNQEEYARSQIPELFQEHCFDPSFLCLSFHSCCLIRITLCTVTATQESGAILCL